jgi:regulatory protein
VAQKWRVTGSDSKRRPKRPPKPLDRDSLPEIALRYAGRYATTRAKLHAYLDRKLRERGWAGEDMPDVGALVTRMAELRYVDDAAFATMKAAAIGRRGYGARRVSEALKLAGVEEADREAPEQEARANRWEAARRLAQRKRIGPYALDPADRPQREKQIAAFLRAGHDLAMARLWVNASPGELPDGGEEWE